jgi:tryptophan synthase alpha chain
MPALDDQFARLRASGRKAFIPFLTAGDPDLDFTIEAMKRLAEAGASVIEIGLPYSDPIADGAVIQASYTRSLARGIKVKDIFAALATVTPTLGVPVVTMTSYAIVFRHGPEHFADEAVSAGLAGAIVPDLPVEESESLAEVFRSRGLSLIQLVTPTTSAERSERIVAASSGFLYYVSIAGITGERTSLPDDLVANVTRLRSQSGLPVCVGFGISQPEHVRQLRDVADGVIVGSALVRRQEEAQSRGRDTALEELSGLARSLASALNGAP